MLSYYFPPLGMGGTQRLLGFARHLPEFGWHPTVVTVKPVRYHAYDQNLHAAAAAIDVERTGSLDPLRLLYKLSGNAGQTGSGVPSRLSRLLRRSADWLLMPDNKILWTPFAYRRARALQQDQHFDALLSSGPPHSSHLIARRLARKHRLPWIADFRDSWAGGDFQATPTPLHRRLDKALQRAVLRRADHVTAVSAGLRQSLAAATIAPVPITVLTNGYDEADFRGPVTRSERFDVMHVGTIGNFARAETALAVYRHFIIDAGLPAEATRLHFVGADLTGNLPRLIAGYGLEDYVEHTGYLPHAEAVQRLRGAHLLLYLVDGTPSPGFIPGKTFEYLAAQRPVLAIAEPVEGVQLLKAVAGHVRHVPPHRPDLAVLALKAFFAEQKKGERAPAPAVDVRQFSRRLLTNQLAAILDALVAGVVPKQQDDTESV